jgi:hypothetical protein
MAPQVRQGDEGGGIKTSGTVFEFTAFTALMA